MNPPFSRYTLTAEAVDIETRFRTAVPDFFRKRFNAAPAQLLPVILADQPQGLSFFYWGLFPALVGNRSVSEKVITRRAEDLLSKTLYRKVLRSHRCLVPADGFYLWKPLTRRTMIPYRVVVPSMGLFGLAGVWEEFEDERGDPQHTFSIVTIPANGKTMELGERMPLILSTEQEKVWVDMHAAEASVRAILETPANISTDHYTVSPAIEESGKDLPSMIHPAPPADQFGNLTLFG